MTDIERIDGEIEKRRKLIAKFEADSVAVSKRIEALKASRESLSPSAMSGDTESKKKLHVARDEQRAKELELEDLASAIAGARHENEQLRAEREQALQAEALVQYEAKANIAVEQAHAIENHASALATLLLEHHDTLRKLTVLAANAGRPRPFRTGSATDAVMFKLAKALPGAFSRPQEKRNDRNYAAFFENHVKLAGTNHETDKTAATSGE